MTITAAEAGKVLAAARLLDNRSWDEDTARAWAATIRADVTLEDAYAAVRDHYARTRSWIMPADINDWVTARRQERASRLRVAGPPDFPNGLTQLEERRYRIAWQELVGRGATAEQATAQTDTLLGYDRGELVAAPAAVRAALEQFTSGRGVA